MTVTVESLLQGNNFPPVLFLFGEENFLMEESLNRIINHLCPDEASRYDLDVLSADETYQNDICIKASAYPMSSSRRVVAVKNIQLLFTSKSKKAPKGSQLANYLNSPSPNSILILTAEIDTFAGITSSLKGKNSITASKQIENAKFPYNILLSKFAWIEFPKLYESQYPSWITQRIKNNGKTINQDAIELLIAQTIPSLRDLNNEIEKLCLFVQDRKTINIDDVGSIAGSTRANNVFELQNAVGACDLNKSLTILYNMLANQRQEMLIITMLTRYFVSIWKLQEEVAKTSNNAQLAGKIGVSPYFMKDYLNAANQYKPSQVNNALIALCDADLQLKSTGSDNLLIMQNLITRIITGSK